MSNLVLPMLPGMIFPVVKTPVWKNSIQEAVSGLETRISLWSYPRWRYELGFDLLRDTAASNELWQLLDFFNYHQGTFDDWLFNDPNDNSVTDMQFGTGDGSTTAFQLYRKRGLFSEPVKNVNGSATIKKAGVTQTISTNYTINSTGLVTFTAAPAAGASLTWTGNFYWRCRFNEDDSFSVEEFAYQMWEAQKLEFISVKQ